MILSHHFILSQSICDYLIYYIIFIRFFVMPIIFFEWLLLKNGEQKVTHFGPLGYLCIQKSPDKQKKSDEGTIFIFWKKNAFGKVIWKHLSVDLGLVFTDITCFRSCRCNIFHEALCYLLIGWLLFSIVMSISRSVHVRGDNYGSGWSGY